MTDQPSQPAAPAQPAPAKPAAPEPESAGTDGLTADEEAKLGELLAKRDAAAAGGTVRMKVQGPEGTSLTHGGVTIGTDFTDVPAWHAAAMTTAAADAGMEIEQEES